MAQQETGSTIVGALLFMSGLTLVVVLGLELVTGAYGIVTMSVYERRSSAVRCLRVFWCLIVGHFLGGLASAWMITAVLTGMGTVTGDPTAEGLIDLAVGKTLDHRDAGAAVVLSWATISAELCYWLVVHGVFMVFYSHRSC